MYPTGATVDIQSMYGTTTQSVFLHFLVSRSRESGGVLRIV